MRRPRHRRPLAVVGFALTVLTAVGCHTTPTAPDRTTVGAALTERFGPQLGCPVPSAGPTLPPGVAIEDGLTEDEAVAVAVWNNAFFHEQLADLGIARGDLIQAGLLPNPEAAYFFGVTDKPFRYLVDFPLEALWLRPVRVRAAKGEADRVSARLSQVGLDLIRDTRQGYADVALAAERARVADDGVKLRGKIAELAERRLKEGDASEQEVATARIDALQAVRDATRAAADVGIFEERLRNLLGVGAWRGPLPLTPTAGPPLATYDPDALTRFALDTRPDALAAATAAAAAAERLKFAKTGWVKVLGILDATSGVNGHEFGPGVRFTLPVFNQNQGAVARAEAELERAVRARQTVADQIVLDVQRAYRQYRQAVAELEVVRAKIQPELDASVRRAETAYEQGDVGIFLVLEATRQRLDNALREAQLSADLRRTWADLERSVGRRLLPPTFGANPK